MDETERVFGFEVGILRVLKADYLIILESKGIDESIIPEIKRVIVGETISGVSALPIPFSAFLLHSISSLPSFSSFPED